MALKFRKMHGLGNDFVVLDVRDGKMNVGPDLARALADRRRGVGCDQVMVMEPPKTPGTDIFMRIYNPDGSEAGACGNGTRCVAKVLMEESGKGACVIETVSGILPANKADGGLVTVDMGAPRTAWNEIPLSEERDTLHLGIGDGDTLSDPVAINMGNPHCVFFVNNVEELSIEHLGPSVERHAMFPQRTNVEFAQVISPTKIRMRVWERGTGVTQACGSGACATAAAALRRGLIGRDVEVVLDGGSLFFHIREDDGHILMTGAATDVFAGEMAA